jgi:hypothetical protein
MPAQGMAEGEKEKHRGQIKAQMNRLLDEHCVRHKKGLLHYTATTVARPQVY